MIVYITGASGSGKTTILKDLPIKGYDLDNLYHSNLQKHKKVSAVHKGVKKDIDVLLSKHKHIVFIGAQSKEDMPFTPDIVYILVRKDYEQYYRDKLIRDLNLLCKYKNEFVDVLTKEPVIDFKNHFWSNSIVDMKSLDEFKKYVNKTNSNLQKNFPDAKMLTYDTIVNKLKKLL